MIEDVNRKIKYVVYVNLLILVFLNSIQFGFTSENKYDIAGFDSPNVVKDFFNDLQLSVKNNNIKHIADLILYPISVYIKGKKVEIDTEQQFMDNYKIIFNEAVRNAVLKSNWDKLFANSRGVKIGRGKIWFASLIVDGKDETLIIKINNRSPK